MMPPTECPFCSVPSDRITRENDLAYVTKDKSPVTKGHVLVIPKPNASRANGTKRIRLRANLF